MTKKGEGKLTALGKILHAAQIKVQELEKQKIPPGKWVPFECYRCEEESCDGCRYEGVIIEGMPG